MNGLLYQYFWHCHKARYYNPQVSVWLVVDALADKSPNKSPYHFVSNNPVMRIDPDGLHDYGLNQEGEVVHLRDTEDDFDQLIILDSKGNETDKKLQVAQCTFGNGYENGESKGFFINSNEGDAEKIFYFMANEFDGGANEDGTKRKELKFSKVTGERNVHTMSIIFTDGNNENTNTLGAMFRIETRHGYTVKSTKHSHPGGSIGSIPSGWTNEKSLGLYGDRLFAKTVKDILGSGIEHSMYHP